MPGRGAAAKHAMRFDGEPKEVLSVQNLCVQAGGRTLLHEITLDIWSGYVHAIVGPNGAGKSTLAHSIMGLPGYHVTSGDILLDGTSIRDLPIHERVRRGLTLAWQEPARFEGLGVAEFILAGALQKREETLREALAMVGLDPALYANRAVDRTLSGGERKRIELASILAMNPRIVMMDEPDSGVDMDAMRFILEAIQGLRERGTTVILITHSLSVLRHADHAFLLCAGRLIEKGTADKIIPYFEGTCLPCKHVNVPDKNAVGAAS
jgi:Fe-S cluster assembly ATP-binding protein